VSDALVNQLASSTRIVRRSLLSAVFLTVLSAVLLVAPDFNDLICPELAGLLPLLIILAIPVAHGAYEIVMPFHRRISQQAVMRTFRDTVGSQQDISTIDYEFLRGWRHTFLDHPTSDSLKRELEKNLAMRQQLTYLFANAWSGIVIILVVAVWGDTKWPTAGIGIPVVAILAVVVSVAHWNRSLALGRSYGRAYLSSVQNKNESAV